MKDYAVELREVSYQYQGHSQPAIHGIDLKIEKGSFVLVSGASGSGKTTLSRCINGLVPHFYEGTFMGTISALPGLMAANVIGVVASIVGWIIAEIVASANHYRSKKVLIFTYVLGCTLHSAGFTLPMYLSNAQYLIDRQEILHLTDEALAVYLQMFTWPMYFGMVALTVITSFLGAVISTRILKKHFEKAGLL